jgi:signal transduction histidine kinase
MSPATAPLRSVAPALIGLALLLSAMEASQLYFRAALEGWQVTGGSLIGRALVSWLTFAALTPLTLVALRRWPLDRPLTGGHLAAHALAAVTFTALHLGITGAILPLVVDHPFGMLVGYLFVAYAALDLLLYVVMVGGWHAYGTRRDLQARQLRASRLEHDLKRSQLEVLRLQLQPHFLYNTLNAIAGLALREEGRRTADAIALLGDLLRENLAQDAAAEFPLRDEIQLAERYFEVWRLRLGEQVMLTTTLAAGVEPLLVPRFLLQPLIENAVAHGILPTGRPGRIIIAAARQGAALELTVEDDGRGLAQRETQEGLGLSNLRERLASLYGARGGLELGPRAGGGTRVRVVLPALEAPAEDRR